MKMIWTTEFLSFESYQVYWLSLFMINLSRPSLDLYLDRLNDVKTYSALKSYFLL